MSWTGSYCLSKFELLHSSTLDKTTAMANYDWSFQSIHISLKIISSVWYLISGLTANTRKHIKYPKTTHTQAHTHTCTLTQHKQNTKNFYCCWVSIQIFITTLSKSDSKRSAAFLSSLLREKKENDRTEEPPRLLQNTFITKRKLLLLMNSQPDIYMDI